MEKKINGVVEAVGTQYNGSVKVNGEWFNNKKGVKNPAKVGDTVTLTLSEYDFKGKKGFNITGVEVSGNAPQVADAPLQAKSVGRDFDKEAKGKTACALLAALYANPSVNVEDLDGVFSKVDAGVKFIFGK